MTGNSSNLVPSLLADGGARCRGFLHRRDDSGDGFQDERYFRRLLTLQRDVPVQLDAVDGVLKDLGQKMTALFSTKM